MAEIALGLKPRCPHVSGTDRRRGPGRVPPHARARWASEVPSRIRGRDDVKSFGTLPGSPPPPRLAGTVAEACAARPRFRAVWAEDSSRDESRSAMTALAP